MRVFFLIATIFVAAALAVDHEVLPSLRGMQSISISYQTPEQFSFLKNFMDTPGFEFVKTTSDLVDVLVTGDKVESFKQLLDEENMDYTVMIEDVEEIVTEEYITQEVERRLKSRIQEDYASGRLSFTYYPKYNEVNEYLDYLTKTYGNVASLITIGNSYEGRVMKVLKLSTGGKNKPAIFIDGGIHAREWIAPATVLYMVDLMLSSHKDLLNKVDWYVLPVLNPDGYEFTHTKSANRLWRKTRSPNKGSNCVGVDGNRNYDMGWMEIGASNNPCSETYAGPKAFSEVENQHLRDFILARKGQFKAYLTFHSYGQYILYPWGFTSQVPSNEPELRNLASSCAKAIAKSRKTQYTYGTSANHLYPAAGGSDDWAMGKAGINLSYTFELPGGNYGFLLPASEIKAVGTETFEAIKQIHQYVTSKYASR
ncbi:carboxypeptidase B [Apis mellifera carnica]|uniref:Carboxypeptidase B n=1 Tax=Apis mellifera TaxID=7460 RepID=A0A7M7R7Q7_APIME|nr:carboxypeptidase B [Apis mellifera]KAG9429549.1 carboxypeptidase B [Apis mellifera carnica]|eukprot:XP_623727.2 carboxypeptidase B [Apis mellifera]